MSNFTPLVTKKYKFQDDDVSVTFARLKRKHMLQVMPFLSAMTKAKETNDTDAETENVSHVLNILLDKLPDYVHRIEGLTNSDGEEIPVATVADEMYFVNLATDITLDLLNESVVIDGKDSKNL